MKDVVEVSYLSDLPFGEGNIGVGFENEQERLTFEAGLRECVVPLTKENTADCVDERETLEFADGTNDPAIIEERVVPQIQGGLGLASTKAAVAADIELIRGAKNFQEAYLTVMGALAAEDFEDGGHEHCGASMKMETSVEKSLAAEEAATVGSLLIPHPQIGSIFAELRVNKLHRLEEGYYGAWDHNWHEGYLAAKFPQNFARLKGADDATSGHYGRALLAVTRQGYGFKKNGLIRLTSMHSFAATTKTVSDVANVLGKDVEEQWKLIFGFVDDLENVGNVLFKEKMRTYSAA